MMLCFVTVKGHETYEDLAQTQLQRVTTLGRVAPELRADSNWTWEPFLKRWTEVLEAL